MKKSFTILFILIIIFSCKIEKNSSTTYNSINHKNLPLNERQQVVLDLSFIFDSLETKILSKKIIDFEKSSTNQIVILTTDSIKPYNNIQKYGTDVANYWGLGAKEKDNGLLIVLCNTNRKISISTGYGTEKIITDSICKSIIDNTMIPSFKQNNYFEGVNNALDSIIKKWY